MKPISYKQEMADTERICTWEGPTESCSVSLPDCLVYLFFPSSLLTSAQRNLALVWVLKSFFLYFFPQTFVLYSGGSLFF